MYCETRLQPLSSKLIFCYFSKIPNQLAQSPLSESIVVRSITFYCMYIQVLRHVTSVHLSYRILDQSTGNDSNALNMCKTSFLLRVISGINRHIRVACDFRLQRWLAMLNHR